MKTSPTALVGLKEICAYARMSTPRVKIAIQEYGFPARQIIGTEWQSDMQLVDEWRRERIGRGAA
ncbi:hypothetical protein LZ24_02504 [Desulfobotulus alkaliphilus]|uniref:AlpA family transcriptional regulator n=1 Tax=Desulfobotulus alkaliphilus TaxID=622671 RepID=A0A562RHF9_9BACT|nr:hypothetical protein [Desulfobotulus alkaliphilus]TWI68532.1 hypothetical protein LZ24_02504 [Desulfobotulus alkaliphilus]